MRFSLNQFKSYTKDGGINICRRYLSALTADNHKTDTLKSTINEGTELTHKYTPTIGLEIHAQIASQSKLFSRASTSYISAPNSQVSPFDIALPGTLPVLNIRCVEAAIITALALNCHVNKKCSFDRKHYFYADMPLGFQITQQSHPIASNGHIDFIVYDQNKSYMRRSRLKQIQLEQDSGKSLQDEVNGRSLVDLNRAGIGLMELVFEPDLLNANEAACLVKELVLILKRIDTCTCRMNEGALRVDANVSVHRDGEPFGVRTEVKNLNSFRFISNAIDYEINRQISVIENGGDVMNETRMYDPKFKQTIAMRDKEVVQDYRFMPEPNLPPLYLSDDNDCHDNPQLLNIDDYRRRMPKSVSDDREHLINNRQLSLSDVFVLMNENGMMKLFEEILNLSKFQQKTSELFKFIHTELRAVLENGKLDFCQTKLSSATIAEVFDLLVNDDISIGTAHDVLMILLNDVNRNANDIIKEYNWGMIKDRDTVKQLCTDSINTNRKIAKRYAKKRKRKVKSVLVMHVLKATNNRVNEEFIWEIIDELIFTDKILGEVKSAEIPDDVD